MNFFLRIATSITVGILVYVVMFILGTNDAERILAAITFNPDRFFSTFDPHWVNFEERIATYWGVLSGFFTFIWWNKIGKED